MGKLEKELDEERVSYVLVRVIHDIVPCLDITRAMQVIVGQA